jgi:hypothetical protein
LYFNAATPAQFVYGNSVDNKKFYYDTFSLTVRNNTLNSNWSLTGISYGQRVESGGSAEYPAIGDFGADFNNLCNINVGVYSNEIQLVYGAYRTFCNAVRLNGYLNYDQFFNPFSATGYTYPNYSVINSTNKRYITTKYSFSATTNSSNWKSANIHFTFDDAPFAYNGTIFPGIDIFYRIVASNNTSPATTNLTTAWLNANIIASVPPNAITKNMNNTAGAFSYVNIASDNDDIKVFFPTLNYSNVNFSFYVRVGIPMNCNISLKYIDLTPSIAGAIPGALSNLVINNAASMPLTNTTMTWERQNDDISITNFQINYAAMKSNAGSIVYPRRYLNTVISDTGSFNSNVVSVPNVQLSYTYNFTPSNYDTYYYGTVFASNISGRSNTLSNDSINRTPLPSNIGSDFGTGLVLCNGNYASIVYSRSGVHFQTSNSVEGSRIYKSNGLFHNAADFTSRPFYVYNSVGVTPSIIINRNNPGDGLSNIIWSVTLLSNGTQVTMVTPAPSISPLQPPLQKLSSLHNVNSVASPSATSNTG